jgi:hypothetical protein
MSARRVAADVVQQFVIVVNQLPNQQQLDRLVGRRGDLSVVFYPEEGFAEVMFDRPARTLIEAIVSGIRDLDRVGLVASSVQDDDDLVTLATIADRIGKSRDRSTGTSAPRTTAGARSHRGCATGWESRFPIRSRS